MEKGRAQGKHTSQSRGELRNGKMTKAMALVVPAMGGSWKNSQHSTNFILEIIWGSVENGMGEGAGNPSQKSFEGRLGASVS